MDQAAEPIPAKDPHGCGRSGQTRVPARRSLPQRPVRPMQIVMIGILAKDQPQVSLAGDQHPVQALAAGAGDPAFRDRVRRGARTGVLMIRILVAVSTASNAAVNLASRSRIKNLKPSARSPRFISRLRACWVTHSPSGEP